MPHQCVRCGTLYPAGCNELLTGCKCGGRFFFFVKEESLARAKEAMSNLSNKEKEQIEHDVMSIIGDYDENNPIILDFESINIKEPGKYEIDLVDLFKGKPLVYKLDEGKYMIDIVSTFESKNEEE